jgi:hypothetical protein
MWTIRAAGIVALGLASAIAGCVFHFADDCEVLLDCTGGTGGPPAGCVPSMVMGAVPDSCGVFVSPNGDDGNAGTKEKPLKTITAALTKGTVVYACVGPMPFSEAVTVPAGVAIYGGVDCASWGYVGDKIKTGITAAAGMVPVTLAMGLGAKLVDLHVTAAAAVDPGGSSIALVADMATATIAGSTLEAGDGAAGVAGKPYASAAAAGMMGDKGTDACMANMVVGGSAVMSMCGNPDSTSGLGGTGTTTVGGDGSAGQPGTTSNGGKGEGMMACAAGTKGDDGAPGMPGAGATGIGLLSAAGYNGVAGTDGGGGAVGQGGGGGGGAKGGTGANMCPMGMAGGASGGSGGSGGCGGAGGKGGGAGGSSIALISFTATLTLTSVTLKTGNGGKGGDGGIGQTGGGGGMPGPGGKVPMGSALNPGCGGGPGGAGGNGGKGGGGSGGHSLGIAAMGQAPAMRGSTASTGMSGAAGKGDDMMGNMGDGAAGMAAPCWDFGSDAACK